MQSSTSYGHSGFDAPPVESPYTRSGQAVIAARRGTKLPVSQQGMWPPEHSPVTPPVSQKPQHILVREDAGFEGVRYAIEHEDSVVVKSPTDATSHVHFIPGGMRANAEQERLADAYQQQSTSRSYAPAAVYPGQARPGEPMREEKVKNLADFELAGRDVGWSTSTVGGYVGMTQCSSDVDEKATQRTFDDLHKTYFNPAPPTRTEKGNNAAYNQHYQHRMTFREESYKNTPGRAGGAYASDWVRPGFHNEELWRSGMQGHAPRTTMKADNPMVFRQRADENPNREGLRPQYFDVYGSGYEQLTNHRRVQNTVTEEIDHNLLLAYNTNPYTQVIGQVPPR